MALPGLSTSARNSVDSAGLSEQSNSCCCQCQCNNGAPEGRQPFGRCRITEISDDVENETATTSGETQALERRRPRSVEWSRSSALVPWRLPAPPGVSRNPSNRSATNNENNVSLINYIRRSSSVSSSDNQNVTTQQSNQSNCNIHLPDNHNTHHNGRNRCHHECHYRSRRFATTSRARSRDRRSRMATMMPLSAWNLSRMQYPLPLEPPPPYRPWQLPPYLENDPVPSYRSRATTPASSVYAASD